LKVVTADTRFTANEGYTSGSNSMEGQRQPRSRMRPRKCARFWSRKPRARLDLPAENLRTESGAVISPDGTALGYGELVAATCCCAGAAEIEAEGSGVVSR